MADRARDQLQKLAVFGVQGHAPESSFVASELLGAAARAQAPLPAVPPCAPPLLRAGLHLDGVYHA